jgi:hypothetical protein
MTIDDAHKPYDELAAGFALGALEPGEEQAFREHLASCDRCAATTASFLDVAGDLASLSAGQAPPTSLWQNIRSAIDEEAGAPVVAMPDRASRRRRPALFIGAAAAGIAVLAGVGGWQLASRLGHSSQPNVAAAVATCEASTSCKAVRLLQPGTGNITAVALVRDRRVEVISTGLAPIPSGRQIYVLWQMLRDGRPAGVLSFVVTGTHPTTARGTLPRQYGDTIGFAISLEIGTTIPATPSPPLAVATAI